ncbi:MAG: hypothetical protein QN716_12105, partial [Nitrososphaeraceae archaeon]|nr:hypothetical protein [Nitrososphaeraceae archaeon]
FWNSINNSGIILEIIGFVLMLKATGHLKQKDGGFTSGLDHVENVMSIVRPRFYYIGIGLIIAGLTIQIVPSIFS